ncbi:galactose mutarotase-like domain-containing protein [Suillus subalutaceus]|uniref:galactose mutarotase-like domain-containing protein n=1 Tax=Suillus subalutaceus TaxID=48586 RepID=UPI001B870345|nr:galactose mutarotase-like domain-containing protein [Suillus subalutaceus]KAG1870753.1 galactose mutarotase-like domain-containing protein [Suillus subalutaceus]
MMEKRYQGEWLSLSSALTPPLAVEVLPHGVTIHRIIVQVEGKTHDILIGPENPKDYETFKYTNTIIGRYANRVRVGEHIVKKDGFERLARPVSNESPEVSLHGGLVGFDFAVWQRLSLENAKLFTPAEIRTIQTSSTSESSNNTAIYTYTSEDGDQGYPGELHLETLVALLPPAQGEKGKLGSIVILYRARLANEGVTPINLTQHWGFNLDASLQEGESGRDKLSVKNHRLNIKASHTAELLPNSLPSGKYCPVGGTVHEHNDKLIKEGCPDHGYDHYYLLAPRLCEKLVPHRISAKDFDTAKAGEELNIVKEIFESTNEPVVQLKSEKSGLKVDFDSNQAGLMFYTNNHPNKQFRKKIHGGPGMKDDGYIKGSAAFLEFHEPLSAFLHPEATPNSTDTLLTSNEIYNNFVRADIFMDSECVREG